MQPSRKNIESESREMLKVRAVLKKIDEPTIAEEEESRESNLDSVEIQEGGSSEFAAKTKKIMGMDGHSRNKWKWTNL